MNIMWDLNSRLNSRLFANVNHLIDKADNCTETKFADYCVSIALDNEDLTEIRQLAINAFKWWNNSKSYPNYSTMYTCENVYRTGGSWLGAVRKWIQLHVKNGDNVTWGSDEKITISVRELEEAADYAVAADRRNNQ